MKFLLSILLILVALFTCFVEDLYLLAFPPERDQSLFITLRAHTPFQFDQEQALNNKRSLALSRYIPVYRFQAESMKTAKTKMMRLIMKVHSLQGQKKRSAAELQAFLNEEFGIEYEAGALSRLLGYNDLVKLLTGILTLEETILQEKVLEDMSALEGKKTLEILYPDPAGSVLYSAEEVISLKRARRMLKERAASLFWKVDKRLINTAIGISLVTLNPNLVYDDKENSRRLDDIVLRFPSTVVAFTTGQVLLPMGKKLDDEDLYLLERYHGFRKSDLAQTAPWIVMAIMLMVALMSSMFSEHLMGRNAHPEYLMAVLIIVLLMLRMLLLFTALPVMALPVAVLPLILLLIRQKPIPVMCVTLVGAAITAIFSGGRFDLLFYFSFGIAAAILTFPEIQKKWQIWIPALAVGLINLVFCGAVTVAPAFVGSGITMFQQMDADAIFALLGAVSFSQAGWALLSGLAAGPLALLILPVLELSSRTASVFKLNKFADLHHPLMKQILTTSPGTYQHTMMVAHLSQAVGEAVGADLLLLRVGAYYHDLGKIADPQFFMENQFAGKNIHDELDPDESREIIIHHVLEGERLARKNKLPQAVIDLILQHHGTQVVEYFYNKALKNFPPDRINEEDYRYPGPKPQTLEAAILMIADSTEAAARTIEEPTREKIEGLVRHVIEAKLFKGQLDECDLSSRQISVIIQTLVDSLVASLHSRIKYPWQEKEEDE